MSFDQVVKDTWRKCELQMFCLVSPELYKPFLVAAGVSVHRVLDIESTVHVEIYIILAKYNYATAQSVRFP
jgi:hypothetical protein